MESLERNHPAIINAVRHALTPKAPVMTEIQQEVISGLKSGVWMMAKQIGVYTGGTYQGLVKRGLIEARDAKGGVKEYRIKRKSRARYMLNGSTAMSRVLFARGV